ncbi:MAG: electron transfer flavoprotein subunit beta/FixA family protein [Deltaproteobacteria bacterium]|nr:electron transfer flavoprotein subunit beta/FixA family protein [Deltaproteobacteria bacterium]MCF8119075.1 electron transfer flavoprotein subunit beta/FixA family protein [Deltaproteobacteria bacterium]
MDIVVCIKRVPLIQEVDLEINDAQTGVRDEALAYVINDWDNYAVEEAVILKEQLGGSVTAITVGSEADEEVLRRALAMGADQALRIDPGSRQLDGFVISRILTKAIGTMTYDLILTGVQADDDNGGMVGSMVAEGLGIGHAAVITAINIKDGEAVVHTELEGGMDEVSKVKLPALLSIQTGINEPRYVSIMGIRKARKKELKVTDLESLGLSEDDLTPRTVVEQVFFPPETAGAEMIQGDAGAVAETLLNLLKEKGVSK